MMMMMMMMTRQVLSYAMRQSVESLISPTDIRNSKVPGGLLFNNSFLISLLMFCTNYYFPLANGS